MAAQRRRLSLSHSSSRSSSCIAQHTGAGHRRRSRRSAAAQRRSRSRSLSRSLLEFSSCSAAGTGRRAGRAGCRSFSLPRIETEPRPCCRWWCTHGRGLGPRVARRNAEVAKESQGGEQQCARAVENWGQGPSPIYHKRAPVRLHALEGRNIPTTPSRKFGMHPPARQGLLDKDYYSNQQIPPGMSFFFAKSRVAHGGISRAWCDGSEPVRRLCK